MIDIKEEDEVSVVYSNLTYSAKIIRTPKGEGDLWQVDYGNGVHAINPYNKDFIAFRKENKI